MKIYIQTAATLADFAFLASKTTNMMEGASIVHTAAVVIGDASTAWKRNFCATHLARFAKSNHYRILMGDVQRDARQYYFQPHPF